MLISTHCHVVYSYITTKYQFRNFKSWVIHVPETSETVKNLRWERLLVITCKNIYIYVLMQRGFYFSNYMNTNQSFTADRKESNNRVAFSNFDENTTLLPLVWVQWRAVIPLRTPSFLWNKPGEETGLSLLLFACVWRYGRVCRRNHCCIFKSDIVRKRRKEMKRVKVGKNAIFLHFWEQGLYLHLLFVFRVYRTYSSGQPVPAM